MAVISVTQHYRMNVDTLTAILAEYLRSDLQERCSLQPLTKTLLKFNAASKLYIPIVMRSPSITVRIVWHDPQHNLPAACKLNMHGMHWWWLVRLSITGLRIHCGAAMLLYFIPTRGFPFSASKAAGNTRTTSRLELIACAAYASAAA